jgi:maltooligosyltrehalose trehalohydrolase
VERERGSDRTPNAAALEPEGDGYFSGAVTFLGPGTLYGFRLDGSATLYPDPASRFQPDGPHGPSQVVDPSLFTWSDQAFRGVPREGQVIYELHVGTFTREGTFLAALAELPELQRLGITLIELMPIADFPGRFGWGYDGVDLWAPTRLYGTPDELRRFVDEAHRLGLGVILDVVYNHLGPDGNYLKVFSPHYFTDRYDNEWGEALNFDGEHSTAVRQFFVENAAYWIDEFHFDGLRLDATQSIHDASPTHLIAELTERMRAAARAQDKTLYIVAENEPQHAEVARPVKNAGYGCDALWNDDFHHTARVALTGKREAYYMDYCGSPQELISAIKWGYLYQGQHYFWQDQRRGKSALDLSATQYVTYLQNHDQIANSLCGDRIHKLSSAAELRAMTALMLLAPATPMLFQGQEFASSTPFLYFADHKPDLARLVTKGRREFLQQFPSIAMPDANPKVPDASEYSTFERCKLDFSERERNRSVYDLHADLLRLRREDPAFRQQLRERVHGAVLSSHAFVLRYECDAGDRLLLVNLGFDLELRPAPEPLLATPDDEPWQVVWCSEHPKYGGSGFGEPYNDGMWSIPARSATVFVAG